MSRPDHFCPGCGTPIKSFPRYPWHFCLSCCKSATDADGRALRLSGGMGFSWRYDDATEDDWVDCIYIRALIKGRKVLVHEARFGGIVAEPLRDVPLRDMYGLIDLTRPGRYTPPAPSGPFGKGRS